MHAIVAQACLQPFEQSCHRFVASTLATFDEQAARMTDKSCWCPGPQADALDRCRQMQPLQPLAEHMTHPLGVTRGTGKTKGKNGRRSLPRAAFVPKLENAFTDSTTSCSKPTAQGIDQATCSPAERRCLLGLQWQFQSFGKKLRKDETLPWIRQITQRPRQIGHQPGTQPPRQTGARQAQQVGKRTRAEAGETGLIPWCKGEHRQRQTAEALRQFVERTAGPVVTADRQPLCSQWCRRQSCLRQVTLRGAAGDDALEQLRGATEQAQ